MPHDLAARHLRCVNWGDALGIAIYRLSPPRTASFTDIDSGQTWTHAERSRYQQSAAYKARRKRLITRRRCDECGDPRGTILWAAFASDIGRETADNTIVLCRDCNNRVFRARQGLGLAA